MSKQTKSYDLLGPATIQVRTGDKLERTLRARKADRIYHALEPAIELLGGKLVHSNAKLRIQGMPCPKCGALTVTATGASAIFTGRANYPANPHRWQCEGCGDGLGTISDLIEASCEDWKAQLKVLRQIGASTPMEQCWTIAEVDGQRTVRNVTRHALDAALPPSHGSTVRLLKVIAHDESQVLSILHDADLPFVEVGIDRVGRPLSRWNCHPSVDERTELDEALLDRRRKRSLTLSSSRSDRDG